MDLCDALLMPVHLQVCCVSITGAISVRGLVPYEFLLTSPQLVSGVCVQAYAQHAVNMALGMRAQPSGICVVFRSSVAPLRSCTSS